MNFKILYTFFIFINLTGFSQEEIFCNPGVHVGAEYLEQYTTILDGKKVAVVGNQSSMVYSTHLVDTLISLNINVVKVFSPEHGFRGKADAGEKVKSGIDAKTGLPIISLYGSNKKPKAEQLKNIDVVLFDIQDVGARFYTYISTLHYVMEACAEQNIKLIILDRPNPNGHYVDGPVLNPKFKSFIGLHEVPVVHGMTIGEYGQMINGEKWLANNLECDLQVITCEGWNHSKYYKLPVKPSPNLPNMTAIYLYPSLCFFEGTVVSVGRGTELPFQIVGHPKYSQTSFMFTPRPTNGAKHPKLDGKVCKGIDFSDTSVLLYQQQNQIHLSWLIDFYNELNMNEAFFLKNKFIDLLAGSSDLRLQILKGMTEEEIRKTWQNDLKTFKLIRKKYLLYTDFE